MKPELRMELPLTEIGSGVGSTDLERETRNSVLDTISLKCPYVKNCHVGTKIHIWSLSCPPSPSTDLIISKH